MAEEALGSPRNAQHGATSPARSPRALRSPRGAHGAVRIQGAHHGAATSPRGAAAAVSKSPRTARSPLRALPRGAAPRSPSSSMELLVGDFVGYFAPDGFIACPLMAC